MKRFLLSTATVLGLSLAAMAVPAKPGTRTFVQSDGTTISLSLIGDENFHTFVTADGLPVQKDVNGDFKYVTADGQISAITAHDLGARSVEEAQFLEKNALNLSVESLARKAADRRAKAKEISKASPNKLPQITNNGSPRVPILLVAYKDYDFRDGKDANKTFDEFFNKGNKSALKYFTDQSNGKYTPQFDIYGPITLDKNRVEYGGNNAYGTDKGIGKMVAEACLGLNESINFKDYDNNGDGECDVLIVLYAGDGEASSYEQDAANSIWPCQWQLSYSDYRRALTLDNVKVDRFAVFNELYGADLSQIDGVGTFCHEFSHCLGLPDFYDTKYSGNFGMGTWSLMSQGSYNDNGYTPIGYSAYEKNYMGWIEIQEAKPNTEYTLPVMNKGSEETDIAVKVTNDLDPDEYYILENRDKQGWDKHMYAKGMLISHVTYDALSWERNDVNDYSLQRMTIFPADNQMKMVNQGGLMVVDYYNLKGDLWPYGKATELTDDSKPAAKVNTGKFMGKPIKDIRRNSDGTISFKFMPGAAQALTAPSLNEATEITETGFTASWSAVTDTDVTYTIELKEQNTSNNRLIENIKATSQAVTDLTNGKTYEFRVKAVPTATGNFTESDWSNMRTVTIGASGIEGIDADSNEGVAEYYNMQGLKVDAEALTPGIYIRRTATSTEKIVVR